MKSQHFRVAMDVFGFWI